MNYFSSFCCLLIVISIAAGACTDDNTTDSGEVVISEEDSIAQRMADEILIDEFIAQQGYDEVLFTERGARYIITEAGNGLEPELNEIVSIDFIGSFLSGQIFDSNIESVALSNGTGKDNIVWDDFRFNYTVDGRQLNFLGQYSYLILMPELKIAVGAALGQMTEGGKAVLLFPSDLALRSSGFDSGQGFVIPENTPLVFEITLTKVRSN